LRTPLNGILAYGEILTSDSSTLQPAEIAEMGQIIHESGKRLERLIENFLIYSQIEMIGTDPQRAGALRKKQTQFPRKIVESSARHQAETAKRNADLRMDLSDRPAAISEEYLTKIVDELVHNAFKFSKPGKGIQISLHPTENSLVLTITDQGPGLESEHLAKVGAYMQFDRKKREQQGSGLGLTISKRLTELHGGSLTIQSESGKGTTVVVRLPLAPVAS
jgi:signal transduction histidine kinase